MFFNLVNLLRLGFTTVLKIDKLNLFSGSTTLLFVALKALNKFVKINTLCETVTLICS